VLDVPEVWPRYLGAIADLTTNLFDVQRLTNRVNALGENRACRHGAARPSFSPELRIGSALVEFAHSANEAKA